MSRVVSLYPILAFGQIEVRRSSQVAADTVPSWLIDEPEILAALSVLAGAGGTAQLGRAPDCHDALVDIDAGTVTFAMVDL